MTPRERYAGLRLDIAGLLLAGLINTVLAPLVAGLLLGPGTLARQPDLLARAGWVADHALRWQGGWLFWFAVTLSFAWSYYALGRHLESAHPWPSLAVGLAVIAAAVDLVGVVINMAVLPGLAAIVGSGDTLAAGFAAAEGLAYALVNVAAFGLYSVAGVLLLPAAWTTADYPRWLLWLGAVEWVIAALASALLVIVPGLATIPLLISFALYAPWVWGGAWWLSRREKAGSE